MVVLFNLFIRVSTADTIAQGNIIQTQVWVRFEDTDIFWLIDVSEETVQNLVCINVFF